MSVPVDRKPERVVQAKTRGIQKIHSRWIENPKGRSRKKLGILKKIQKVMIKKKKNKDRGITVQVGRMGEYTSYWSIDGDFCLWFDEWRLLPNG